MISKRGTPEYQAWLDMRRLNDYDVQKVDSEWLTSFDAFLRDVGPRPEAGYSLLRLDRSQPFNKSNVFWASPAERRQYKWQKLKTAS